jgi:hypothetical protein
MPAGDDVSFSPSIRAFTSSLVSFLDAITTCLYPFFDYFAGMQQNLL